MNIDIKKVEMVLMSKAIPANLLEREVGISRSTITRIRNGQRAFKNLTIETAEKIQKWIDAGNWKE